MDSKPWACKARVCVDIKLQKHGLTISLSIGILQPILRGPQNPNSSRYDDGISWSFSESCLNHQNPNEGSYIGRLVVEAYDYIQRTCMRGRPQGNPNQGDDEFDGLGGLTCHLVTSITLMSPTFNLLSCTWSNLNLVSFGHWS